MSVATTHTSGQVGLDGKSLVLFCPGAYVDIAMGTSRQTQHLLFGIREDVLGTIRHVLLLSSASRLPAKFSDAAKALIQELVTSAMKVRLLC